MVFPEFVPNSIWSWMTTLSWPLHNTFFLPKNMDIFFLFYFFLDIFWTYFGHLEALFGLYLDILNFSLVTVVSDDRRDGRDLKTCFAQKKITKNKFTKKLKIIKLCWVSIQFEFLSFKNPNSDEFVAPWQLMRCSLGSILWFSRCFFVCI